MASKIILLVFSLFTTTALVKADGNLQQGEFNGAYTVLFHESYQAIGIFFLKRTDILQIKTKGPIKAIDIQDKRGDSFSEILEGGVGEEFVTIKLESQRSKGYDFIVDVYGFPEEEDGSNKNPSGETEENKETDSKENSGESNSGEKDSKEKDSKEEHKQSNSNEDDNSEDPKGSSNENASESKDNEDNEEENSNQEEAED